MHRKTNQAKRRPLVGARNKSRKHIKRSSATTLTPVFPETVDHAQISGSVEQLMEKVRFDVMSIIESCESPDNENAYDIGHRDGVAEVRVVMASYFRNLPEEIGTKF
jgi:hypothetical protein